MREGIAEVREGRTFCLSLPLDVPGGRALNARRMPPQLFGTLRDGASAGVQGFCWSYATEDPALTDVVCDEVMLMNTQYSTQWDGLAHIGSRFDADGDGEAEAVFYNGFRAGTDLHPGRTDASAAHDWARYPDPDAQALGVANLALHGVQGRGVLIDLEKHLGRQRVAVGYEQLMRILEADKIAVEEGDMVCLHTGFADTLLAMQIHNVAWASAALWGFYLLGRESGWSRVTAALMTALLFALIPLRGFFPGQPPLGSWIDVLVFFWVELIVMICVAAVVTTILLRAKDASRHPTAD